MGLSGEICSISDVNAGAKDLSSQASKVSIKFLQTFQFCWPEESSATQIGSYDICETVKFGTISASQPGSEKGYPSINEQVGISFGVSERK